MVHDLVKLDFGSVKALPPFVKTTRIMGLRRGEPNLVYLKEISDPGLPESILFPFKIKRSVHLQSENFGARLSGVGQVWVATGPVGQSIKHMDTYGQTDIDTAFCQPMNRHGS
ncbi:hypothetical protein BGX30_008925 [Mortierella sp. GBA39]|nr:hypothetical protein BGX30_008925 [Mortierella sp. GBA39]